MRRIILSVGVLLAAAVGLALILVWLLLPPRLEVPERQDIVLSHVNLLNPGESFAVRQTIVIRSGRILQIRDSTPADPPPLCADCIVMPGLIDAHIHSPPRVALGNQRLFSLMYLMHGVTSVRDVGASDGSILPLRNKLNSGKMLGPHMYACGPVLEGDPPVWPMGEILKTPDEARAKVANLAQQNVDCIKTYNALPRDVFNAIVDEAANHHIPVIGHVPHDVGIRNAQDFEVQHVTGVPYAHGRAAPPVDDWRDVDLNALTEAELTEVVTISQDRNLSYTPTLINAQRRLIASDSKRWPPTPGSEVLPGFWPVFWQVGMGHPEGQEQIADRQDAVLKLRRVMKALHDNGIDVIAGTDTLMPYVVPGEALIDEIGELAVALGSNEAALATATTVAGRHIAPSEIGTIKVGARADLLVLHSDPRDDLAALRDWDVLVADGRIYERRRLEADMVRYQGHFHGRLYATVVSTIIRFVGRDYAATLEE